jgi:hypothetical protein
MGSGGRAARVSALALLIYISMTATLVVSEGMRELIPQLELPRLMPFQRLLTIWLASYGLASTVRLAVRLPERMRPVRDAAVAVGASIALLIVFTTATGPFASDERGLRHVPRTEGQDAVELWQFERAVALADERAPDGTAILVVGSRLSWHEQLWAPMVAPERRFYYNDWLWYWHQLHAGPYDYRQGHFYPDPSRALAREYLDEHGIGAIVITDIADRSTGTDGRQAAASSPEIVRVDTVGAWDVYTVRDPVAVATLDGSQPASLDVSDNGETMRVQFDDVASGTVTVRQNWFPRWQATVNGERVPVERAEDGYMEIAVPAGDVEVELRYGVTPADIAARALAAMSTIAVIVLVAGAKPIRRWVRR